MNIHRIFTIMIVIIISMFVAGAVPQMPNVFYGNVIIGSDPASDGISVTAEIGGNELASTTTTVGAYSLSVPSDDPNTAEKEGGVNGDIVDFFVNGVAAGTGVFDIGAVTQADLQIDDTCTPTNGGVEACDGTDNDCDGSVDEDFTALGDTCSAGVGECVADGSFVCSEDGTGVVCDAEAGSPADELCDGLDNDCDGDTDEDFLLGDSCSVGVGECASDGVLVCSGDMLSAVCDAEAGSPADELCDGLDNDCDSETDETFPTLGNSCSVGIGACQADGNIVCAAGGDGVECDAVAGSPAAEVCDDGIDNDCDGDADGLDSDCQECTDGQTLACMKQEGVCAGSIQGCVDGVWPGCDYSLIADYEADETTCDHLDNDCDGETDEGCECVTDDTRVCGTDVGICQSGTETCVADVWSGECIGSIGAETEICSDSLDNDCDGATDCDDTDCSLDALCQGEDFASCVDGIDNDDDGDIDCDDPDCASDANCVHTEFCLVNRAAELLDADFNPVDSIEDGELYNIRVTNWNRCDEPVDAMHIVQIEDNVNTPINIGTITTTIQPDEEQTYTVGFTMNSGAGSYTAMIFNWNHWVSQPGWEALSVPGQLDFIVN